MILICVSDFRQLPRPQFLEFFLFPLLTTLRLVFSLLEA